MIGCDDVVLYSVDCDCGLYSGYCGLLVFPGVEKDKGTQGGMLFILNYCRHLQ